VIDALIRMIWNSREKIAATARNFLIFLASTAFHWQLATNFRPLATRFHRPVRCIMRSADRHGPLTSEHFSLTTRQ
jgi:hypothetical protein